MKTSNYKSMIGSDKLPQFHKISRDKFIFKVSEGNQYSVYKHQLWADIWYVKDTLHAMIGYGTNLKQALLVVLNDYLKTRHNSYVVNEASNLLYAIQYGQIIKDCIENEYFVSALSEYRQKFLKIAFIRLNPFLNNLTDKEIFKKIDHQINTAIHCNQSEDYENCGGYNVEEYIKTSTKYRYDRPYTKECYKRSIEADERALALEQKKTRIYNEFISLMLFLQKSNFESTGGFRSYHPIQMRKS